MFRAAKNGPTRWRSGAGRAANLIASLLFLTLLVIALLLVGIPRLLGAHTMTVVSGSMKPALGIGDVVVVKPTDAESLQFGDIITFQLASGRPEVATHRIVGIGEDANGKRSFVTKGDANNVADQDLVTAEQVRGKVMYDLPKIGLVTTIFNADLKRWILFAVASALILYGAKNLFAPTRSPSPRAKPSLDARYAVHEHKTVHTNLPLQPPETHQKFRANECTNTQLFAPKSNLEHLVGQQQETGGRHSSSQNHATSSNHASSPAHAISSSHASSLAHANSSTLAGSPSPTRALRKLTLATALIVGNLVFNSGLEAHAADMPDKPLALSTTGQQWQTEPITDFIPSATQLVPGARYEAHLYLRNLSDKPINNLFTAHVTSPEGVHNLLEVTLPELKGNSVRLEPLESKAVLVRITMVSQATGPETMNVTNHVTLSALSSIARATQSETEVPPTQPEPRPTTTTAQPTPTAKPPNDQPIATDSPTAAEPPIPAAGPSPRANDISIPPTQQHTTNPLAQTGATSMFAAGMIALGLIGAGTAVLTHRKNK